MPKVLRPAGLNEHRCVVRDTLGLYGTVVACATYVSGRPIDKLKDDIIRAVENCVLRHPALSIVIDDAASVKPHLSRVEALDLERQLEFVKSNEAKSDIANLRSLLDYAHNNVLDDWATRPRWRVCVLLPPSNLPRPATFHVAFAYSHVIADGSSGTIFHRSLLRALRRPERRSGSEEGLDVDVENKAELPPPLEQAADMPLSWFFLVPVLAQEILPMWLTKWAGVTESMDSVWRGPENRPVHSTAEGPIRTELRLKRVPANTTRAVLRACRQHNARLTGFVAVVTAKVLSRSLRRRGLAADRFLVPLPLDLRRCLPEMREVIANYPSVTTARISFLSGQGEQSSKGAPVSLCQAEWSIASRITQQLAKAANSLVDQPIALLKYISDMRRWTLEQAAKPAQASFEVSNLGAMEVPPGVEDGLDYAIIDVVFSQSANACGPPFNLNVAGVKEGSMSLTFTWWRGMLAVDDEDVFMDEVADGLVNAFEAVGAVG